MRPAPITFLSDRPALLYSASFLGAHLAFMPLLVLLLPRRVELVAGEHAAVLLSIVLVIGAATAGFAHIAAGYFSDLWFARAGNRRGPIALGLALLLSSYFLLADAFSVPALVTAVVIFQIGLNLAFAPLGALIADYFPDREKGTVAGMMNAALPLSSAAVSVVAFLAPADGVRGFMVSAVFIALLVAPLVLWWPFGPAIPAINQPSVGPSPHRAIMRDFALAWSARFLVQLGASFVIGYLYLYVSLGFGSGSGETVRSATALVGLLSTAAMVAALAAALMAGRISDAIGSRRAPLAVSALLTATGLALLSHREDWHGLLVAYSVFHIGLTAFLSIDTALVAQLVSGSSRRGTLLGLMNLTNTLPAVVAPIATLLALESAASVIALQSAFQFCAVGSATAALLVMGLRSVR